MPEVCTLRRGHVRPGFGALAANAYAYHLHTAQPSTSKGDERRGRPFVAAHCCAERTTPHLSPCTPGGYQPSPGSPPTPLLPLTLLRQLLCFLTPGCWPAQRSAHAPLCLHILLTRSHPVHASAPHHSTDGSQIPVSCPDLSTSTRVIGPTAY